MTRRGGVFAIAVSVVTVAVVMMSACAPTTYDESLASKPTVVTTTTLPTGATDELLDRLIVEAGQLGRLIADRGDRNSVVERIDQLWAAAQPDVEANAEFLFDDFTTAIELIHEAVDRSRAADADKAYRNLIALAAAYRDATT